jgi:ribonucleoside-triphosphate reductase (thioredoxin)
MSVQELQEYTRVSKYARFKPEENRRETWTEQVDRVFDMHERKFDNVHEFREEFDFAKSMVMQKKVLGSQRALQFGGDPILSKNARMYNCTVSYCDRPRFFQEAMYLLLCGCGVGFSTQTHHTCKLNKIKNRIKEEIVYVIPDSIEGWADSIGVLISSFMVGNVPFPEYKGHRVKFDFSKIRPAGTPIKSGSKAPGPAGLQQALLHIETLLNKCLKVGDTIRPIDAYDIVMHSSDAVLSGGVRRSATICIFSPEDDEMATAKTGSWHRDNPQRGRSNNSALLIRDETPKELFAKLMESVKGFGEPGFIWSDSKEALYNPCVEIGMQAYDKAGNSGWQFCNLCEINMKKATTEDKFMDACRAAAIIGTMQASYDEFPYLGKITNEIVKREALLGVSMTGMADAPDIAFDPRIQKKGAKLILSINAELAPLVGVNLCARATCVKPAGTTSCILGTASGIHPHHARRYFRRVQANILEEPLKYFTKFNPSAVEESVWSNSKTDQVITFMCEVPDGAKTKNDVDAITLLQNVKLTQQNWVEFGTRHEVSVAPWLRHNVSNTINVKPDEWDSIEQFIYRNRKWFAGISILPMSGDKDYPQAPFTAVYTPTELVREYGDASVFASGLIVAANSAFDENLWLACDCMLGIGEILDVDKLRVKIASDLETNGVKWIEEGLNPQSPDKLLRSWLQCNVKNYYEKRKLRSRAEIFAKKYFDNDVRKMTYCLKDVQNWKVWCDLKREYVDVDWSKYYEEEFTSGDFGAAGEACAGGTCDLMGLTDHIDKDREKLKKKSSK